jgi:hypothetical protein
LANPTAQQPTIVPKGVYGPDYEVDAVRTDSGIAALPLF